MQYALRKKNSLSYWNLKLEIWDFGDMLPDNVKASINKGIGDANKGELISHKNMVAETKSRYNH